MAELCAPEGLAFDKAGNLYIADYCNYRVRKVGPPVAAAAPTFSLAAGTYSGAQTLTMTDATQGAAIYYTIDGSNPTTSSSAYTAPISRSNHPARTPHSRYCQASRGGLSNHTSR